MNINVAIDFSPSANYLSINIIGWSNPNYPELFYGKTQKLVPTFKMKSEIFDPFHIHFDP